MNNSEIIEYGPDQRYGHLFGHGTFTQIPNHKLTLEETIKLATEAGWSHGCPQSPKLIEQDPEWILNRYIQVNQKYQEMLTIASVDNPIITTLLSAYNIRKIPLELMGNHIPVAVPRSHFWRVAPLAGIEGYSAPRVLIEVTDSQLQDTIFRESLATTGLRYEDFLAILSEKTVTQGKVEPEQILSHIYAQGILDEEHTFEKFSKLATSLDKHAPTLRKTLESLSDSQRKELQIARIPKTI